MARRINGTWGITSEREAREVYNRLERGYMGSVPSICLAEFWSVIRARLMYSAAVAGGIGTVDCSRSGDMRRDFRRGRWLAGARF